MTDFSSGPYCRHWVENGMGCDELCICGHTCDQHFWGDDCLECDCEQFEDAEDDNSLCGTFATSTPKKVIFTKEITLDLNSLPKLKPKVNLKDED